MFSCIFLITTYCLNVLDAINEKWQQMLFKVFAAAENIFYFFKNVHKDDDDDNDDDSNESTNTKPFCSKPTFRSESTHYL